MKLSNNKSGSGCRRRQALIHDKSGGTSGGNGFDDCRAAVFAVSGINYAAVFKQRAGVTAYAFDNE